MSIHQISVFLENRVGQLAQITRILSDHHIDLRALSIADTTDYGILRIIADDTQKATDILLEQGFILSKTPVLVISIPDTPGALAEVLELVAEGQLDIEYMYSLFTNRDGRAYMVFRVSDEAKFTALLQSHNITIASSEELGIH